MDFVWPIISNREAIAINQLWAGEAGNVFSESNETVDLARWTRGVPSWQFFSKAQGRGRVAVLLVNHANTSQELALDFGAVPGLACGGSGTATCSVRDVWGQKELGSFEAEYKSQVASHGSAFLIVSSPTGTGLAKLGEQNAAASTGPGRFSVQRTANGAGWTLVKPDGTPTWLTAVNHLSSFPCMEADKSCLVTDLMANRFHGNWSALAEQFVDDLKSWGFSAAGYGQAEYGLPGQPTHGGQSGWEMYPYFPHYCKPHDETWALV